MEGPHIKPIISDENNLEQKSNQLWQDYSTQQPSLETDLPEDLPESVYPQLVPLEGPQDEEFWANYAQLMDEAKQQQQVNSIDRALTLMEDVFLSNQQQFKSVPIPIGKYFYPQKGWNSSSRWHVILGGAWLSNFLLLGSGLVGGEFIGLLTFFQLSFGVYIITKLVNMLTNKTTQDIVIESNYVSDNVRKLVLAFKDINLLEETEKGLLVKNAHHPHSKKHQLLIPNTTEEYVNIKRFLKQVEAINLHQPNIYTDVAAVRKSYWHNQALVSFGKPKRILVHKISTKGIQNLPTEWAAILGGITTFTMASFFVLGLSLFGFLGIVAGVYALDIFKHKKRFSFNALHVAEDYIQYVFNYNHKTHIIKIPLGEIYGVKKGLRGLKILDIKGKSFWQTDTHPYKKYQPIIPKKMHGIKRLKIFLEEVAEHNRSLL